MDEIQAAIDKYNEARKTLAVCEDVKEKIMMSMMSVEDVGDVKPVLYPNDLAEFCQVTHLPLAAIGALYVNISYNKSSNPLFDTTVDVTKSRIHKLCNPMQLNYILLQLNATTSAFLI